VPAMDASGVLPESGPGARTEPRDTLPHSLQTDSLSLSRPERAASLLRTCHAGRSPPFEPHHS
jgi:hypothetical protein